MAPRRGDLEVAKAFGRLLRVTRAETGESRSEVARRAGMARDTLGRMERGTRDPQLSEVLRLAKALGKTAAQLVDAMEEKP